EDALLALVLAEHVDAPGLELGDRRVVSVAVDHESVVDDVRKPTAAGLASEHHVVVAGLEEHEVGVLLGDLADEFEPEDVGIESRAARGIADRNGEVQDAFGLDHAGASAAATPSHGKVRRQLGENFTGDQHAKAEGAMPAAAVDNSQLKPSRSSRRRR